MTDTFKPFSKITNFLDEFELALVTFEDSFGNNLLCDHIEVTQLDKGGGAETMAIVELSSIASQAQIGGDGVGVSAGASGTGVSGLCGFVVGQYGTTKITLPQGNEVSSIGIKIIHSSAPNTRFLVTYGNIISRNQIGDQRSTQGV